MITLYADDSDRQSAGTAAPLPRRPAVGRRISTDDLGMLLVCLIWGFNFSVTKSAFDQLPPLPFTAIRFAISSLLLWLVLRVVEGPARLPPGAMKRLVTPRAGGEHVLSAGLHAGTGADHRHEQRPHPLHRAHRRGGVRRGARPGADHDPDALGDRPGHAWGGTGDRHARGRLR